MYPITSLLDFPYSLKVHPIFHTFLLKPYHPKPFPYQLILHSLEAGAASVPSKAISDFKITQGMFHHSIYYQGCWILNIEIWKKVFFYIMRGIKVHQHHNRKMSYSVKGNTAQCAGKFEVYFKKYYIFVELMQF